MPLEIPLRSSLPRYEFQITLGDTLNTDGATFSDGRLYTIRLDWNGRASSWSWGMRDDSGETLIAGQALRLGTLRLRKHGRASGLPAGDLVLVDTSGEGTEPGLTSLGASHRLLYYTSSELAGAGL